MTTPDGIIALADALERTMRERHAWTEPPPDLKPFRSPFAMDSMPFEHWLQLVLVPRLREVAAGGAPLPPRSGLAAHAVQAFDGRDDMLPLIDALRAIDAACPAPPSRESVANRRLGASVALVLVAGAWAAVALRVATRAEDAARVLFPATVVQTYTGSAAPDPDFRPLRITVTATVAGDGALRATEGELVALRSPATVSRGPTGPFRFLLRAPPTVGHVVDWLANLGVARGPTAERAATEALDAVTSAAAAHTRAELHDGAATRARVHPDDLLEIPPQRPQWIAAAVTIVVFLAGAVPLTRGLVRWVRRP